MTWPPSSIYADMSITITPSVSKLCFDLDLWVILEQATIPIGPNLSIVKVMNLSEVMESLDVMKILEAMELLNVEETLEVIET